MAATIILLYALNASSPIPVGCFIAAWVGFGAEVITRVIFNRKDKKQ